MGQPKSLILLSIGTDISGKCRTKPVMRCHSSDRWKDTEARSVDELWILSTMLFDSFYFMVVIAS
jgi:hypothetical protein